MARFRAEKIEYRLFTAVSGQFISSTRAAAVAYAYSVAPPFARNANGEPNWSKFKGSWDLGMEMDSKIGSEEDRALAEMAWRVATEYERRGLVRPGREIGPFNTTINFRLPVRDSDLKYYVRIKTPSMFPMNDPGEAGVIYPRMAAHWRRLPALHDQRDIEVWQEWVHGLWTRIHEGWTALCFLDLIRRCEGATNTAMFSAFPWLHTVYEMFYGKRIGSHCFEPWRGHPNELVNYMVDGRLPRAGAHFTPWERADILDHLRSIGEEEVFPTLVKLHTARQIQIADIESRNEKLWRNRPAELLQVSAPFDEHGQAVPFAVPDWYSNYLVPVVGFGKLDGSYTPPNLELVPDIVSAAVI